MKKITLSQDKRFRPKTPQIRKLSYNVVLYSPTLAKDSIDTVKKAFRKASVKGKKEIIDMLRKASEIALNNAKNKRVYRKKDCDRFFQVAFMYRALRRDLAHELKGEE